MARKLRSCSSVAVCPCYRLLRTLAISKHPHVHRVALAQRFWARLPAQRAQFYPTPERPVHLGFFGIPGRAPHTGADGSYQVKAAPEILEKVQTTTWPAIYYSNEIVRRERVAGRSWPLPYAVYLDAVRFNAPLAGRTDSMLGVWTFNLVTNRRHLITCLRTRDMCRCGCRGWCSVYAVMATLSWGAKSLVNGHKPNLLFDGSHPAAGEPGSEFVFVPGDDSNDFGFCGVWLWLKGDWGEVAHSIGLPAIASKNNPCPFCRCNRDDMHDHYDEINLLEWPWEERAEDSYELDCRAREIVVPVNSQEHRDAIVAGLVYLKGRKGRGRTMTSRVGNLVPGDRLVPSATLLDIEKLDSKAVPFVVVFWRARYEAPGGACLDAVINRNPMFDPALGTNPVRTLAIDNLHTGYYGPAMRFTSSVIWRALLSNPWGLGGTTEEKLDLACRRLRADLFEWYDEAAIPSDRRIGDFTVQMIGPDQNCRFGMPEDPHPRGIMKTKAAETGMMLEWSIHLLRTYASIPCRDELLAGGQSLLRWMNIIRGGEQTLAHDELQTLTDCIVRHNLHCKRANVRLVPKHHMCAHMSMRSREHGNPKVYSTLLDESLNLVLRTVSAFAHKLQQVPRIVRMLNLQGAVGLSTYMFGASSD